MQRTWRLVITCLMVAALAVIAVGCGGQEKELADTLYLYNLSLIHI